MARPIWTGTVSFGLVSVPVKLYSAISQKDIGFHQIDEKSGARIRYKRVSEKTGKEVPYERIAKGYEIDDGRYVVIDPDELKALDPKATHSVDIEDFVDLSEIEPIYYEHTYYLVPDKGGEKAYKLLRTAMDEAGKVGIGKVVIRTKQYLCAIRPFDGVLVLNTMLFADEIVPAGELPDIDAGGRVSEKEREMAKRLIGSMSTEFEPEKYKDEYRARVEKLIRDKAKGKTIQVEEPADESPAVVDLIDALKRSVEETGRGARKKKGRGGGARRQARRSA